MYSRRKASEDIVEVETAIWACSNESCKGWMRDNFAFEEVPTCCICQSPMVSTKKNLPQLDNSNRGMKSLPKGVSI